MAPAATDASLENLIELDEFGLDVLHPGGLDTTSKLAAFCGIASGDHVLDVASGTGESALFLVQRTSAAVTGLDRSASMIRRAARKAAEAGARMRLVQGDAHSLPFASASFDHVICECSLTLLDKERALKEMVRVVRPGGSVGFHEICWKEGAPQRVRDRLVELEHERPETLQGWTALVDRLGLRDIRSVDLSELIPDWMDESRRQLGLRGYLRAARRAARMWGLRGLLRILETERLFRSPYLGYGMVVGTRAPGSQ